MHQNLKREYGHNKKTTERKMDDLVFEGYLGRIKNSNTWLYSRINNIDLIKKMRLEKLKSEIDKCVEDVSKHYEEISINSLEEEAQEIVKNEILKKEEIKEVQAPKKKKGMWYLEREIKKYEDVK